MGGKEGKYSCSKDLILLAVVIVILVNKDNVFREDKRDETKRKHKIDYDKFL